VKQLIVALISSAILAGCADMTPTQQRAAGGTALGATGGAVIGALAGNAALGTAIGAGAGLAGGLLYDRSKKNEQTAYQQGYVAGQHSTPSR
jgi:uncharacterized membrane protein